MLTWVLNVITAAFQMMPESVLDGASDVVKTKSFANSSKNYNFRDVEKKKNWNVYYIIYGKSQFHHYFM